MNDFFGILAAGPAFFVSAWVLMLFAGITGSDVGIQPFGYVTSMVVTIGLWLAIAPAVARSPGPARKRPDQSTRGRHSRRCDGTRFTPRG